MNIDLTKEEFRSLLDMLYLSEWLLNAHKVEEDPRTQPYRALEQKILAIAQQSGQFDEWVEYSAEYDTYWNTRAFEVALDEHGFINEYDNDTFWDELTDRLAQRDAIKQSGGVEKFIDLDVEERMMRIFGFENAYNEEFSKYGLERIYIKRSAHRGNRANKRKHRR